MRRFAYRLAFALGYVNVDKMLSEITWEQLDEWLLFAEREPFGLDRQEAMHAHLIQVLSNINRDRKKKSSPFTLQESALPGGDLFEPKPQPRQAWRSIKNALSQFFIGAKRSK